MVWIENINIFSLYFLSCIAILGLIVGSFLNVVILRLPKILHNDWEKQCQLYMTENTSVFSKIETPLPSTPFNLLTPSSHCPICKHPLSAMENIPVLSFLFLKGRCRFCQAAISWRYPLIEILTALLSVITAYHFGFTIATLYALTFTWALIVLTGIDLDHQLLPDNITLPMLWLGLIVNIQTTFTSLTNATLGAIAGYLFLWSIYWLFKLITGKEGMGYGDFKLLAMLGAWLGWEALPLIILLASMSGTFIGILLIVLKKLSRSQPIPFGPFLAFSGWCVMIGSDFFSFYSHFVRIY